MRGTLAGLEEARQESHARHAAGAAALQQAVAEMHVAREAELGGVPPNLTLIPALTLTLPTGVQSARQRWHGCSGSTPSASATQPSSELLKG